MLISRESVNSEFLKQIDDRKTYGDIGRIDEEYYGLTADGLQFLVIISLLKKKLENKGFNEIHYVYEFTQNPSGDELPISVSYRAFSTKEEANNEWKRIKTELEVEHEEASRIARQRINSISSTQSLEGFNRQGIFRRSLNSVKSMFTPTRNKYPHHRLGLYVSNPAIFEAIYNGTESANEMRQSIPKFSTPDPPPIDDSVNPIEVVPDNNENIETPTPVILPDGKNKIQKMIERLNQIIRQ